MARANIICTATDTAAVRVQHAGFYSYIIVNVGDQHSLFLPDNDSGPRFARALAASLLKAADEQDALITAEAERELAADEAAQALGTFVAQKVEGAK